MNMLSEIMAGYALRRANAERAANKRRRLAEAGVPAYSDALKAERAALLRYGKALLDEPEKEGAIKAAFEAERAEIILLQDAALAAAGIARETLLPNYTCALCRDTGYNGDPIKRPCACLTQRLMETALAGTHLSDDVAFENFDLNLFPDEARDPVAPGAKAERTQREYMRGLSGFALRYCDAFPSNPKPNLLFYGPPGLGKTFLLGCMVRKLIESGHNAILLTAYALQDLVLRERIQNQNTLALAPYLNVELLAIDELGGEPRIGNVSSESFFSLLNERSRTRRATLIATNLNMDELRSRYGERVSSRLLDRGSTHLFRFAGKDLRRG